MVVAACIAILASCESVHSIAGTSTQITKANVDVYSLMDPQLIPLAHTIENFEASHGSLSPENLPKWRQPWFPSEPLNEPQWTERMIPGRNGAPEVRVYVVNAGRHGAALRPAILHTHGGGFVIGSAKLALPSLQEMAAALDCVIVSVDYRLAPETPFPGSLEDNYAGLKWLYDNADELGVDRSRIAVMGESAGGGHAAMLAIAARDRGEVPLIFQALVYPMLDDRTGSTHSVPAHIGTILWNTTSNRYGWTSLLGVPAGSQRVPYGAVPARVTNLAGLPPAFIGVGTLDLFVSEDIDYAQRLIDSGVNAELHVIPGAFHGFDGARNTSASKQFTAALKNALSRAFNKPQRE